MVQFDKQYSNCYVSLDILHFSFKVEMLSTAATNQWMDFACTYIDKLYKKR